MTPHQMTVRVYFEDTDHTGIVYHANYLRFCERGRSEWVRNLGLDQRALRDGEGVVFAVRRMVCDYLKPAVYDDSLVVETSLKSASGARVLVDQRVLRGAEVLFTAEVTLVLLTPSGRPARVTSQLAQLLGEVEPKALVQKPTIASLGGKKAE